MPHNTSSSSLFGRLSARSSFMSPKDVKVTVQMLQDTDSVSNEFKRSQPAQAVLDYICELKNIRVKDYLGLRYQDQHKHRYWVDLSRPISHISKNLKNESLHIFLRFRYYPADPTHIRELCTRYQLFAQVQRDLIHGRLHCAQQKAAELGGLILQAQLGDYDPEKHVENYVSQYTLLLKQTPRTEEKIAEFHKSFRGMTTDEAERTFLEKAAELDTYGFDPYCIKDPKDLSDVFIGVNHRGVLIFQSNQKVHSIPWNQLSKVDYIGKELRLIPTDSYTPPIAKENGKELDKDKKSRTVLKYLCPNGNFAKHLWQHILSQQAFFNEQSAIMIKPKFSKPRIPLLSRGSTFRFPSRRVLREIEKEEFQTVSDGDEKNTSGEEHAIAFARYELPRHEPRQPQPWLNKYSIESALEKANHNNNSLERSGIDNIVETPEEEVKTQRGESLAFFNETPAVCVPGPSTSFSSPESQSFDLGHSNVASFTVHLVKYERTPAASPEPEESSETEKSLPNGDVDEPLMTSTPIFHKTESKVNGKANGLVNGNGSVSHRDEDAPVASSSVGRTLTNIVFTSFLVLLLLVALAIAIFERQESADLVESTPWLAEVRHNVYEPTRHYVLQQYNRFYSR